MEGEMTDWVYENEKRNYGMKKKSGINPHELFWALLLLIPITGSLIFHLWVRGQITDMGYKIQALSQLEESLTRTQEKLIVKEEILQSPERIDRIARVRLGMSPLRPDQVLSPRMPPVPIDYSEIAMLNRH